MPSYEDDDPKPYDPTRGFSMEDEITDPLLRISDVERVLLECGLVPKHQVPMIIEALREDAYGHVFDMGDDPFDIKDDFDADDFAT